MVNKIQRAILLSGAAIQFIMLLFPPFIIRGSDYNLNRGYSFIFKAYREDIVNVPLLALQAAVVAFITGLLYFACQRKSA